MCEDEPTGAYSFRFSLDEPEQPLSAITSAVSWVSGVDPRELEPLQDVVDIDSLGVLLRKSHRESQRDRTEPEPPRVEVRFRYGNCHVTVTPTHVIVAPGTNDQR